MTMTVPKHSADPVEDAVASLFVAFYGLRKAGLYQAEYDAMGTVINMLMTDRDHLRKTYKVMP